MPVKFEEICFLWLLIYTKCGKTRFTVVSEQNTEYILVLLFINYCVIFHISNCKPASAPPYIYTDKCGIRPEINIICVALTSGEIRRDLNVRSTNSPSHFVPLVRSSCQITLYVKESNRSCLFVSIGFYFSASP